MAKKKAPLSPVKIEPRLVRYEKAAVVFFEPVDMPEEMVEDIISAYKKSQDGRRNAKSRERYLQKFLSMLNSLELSKHELDAALDDPERFFREVPLVASKEKAEQYSKGFQDKIVEYFEMEARRNADEARPDDENVNVLDHMICIFPLEGGGAAHLYVYAREPYNNVIN